MHYYLKDTGWNEFFVYDEDVTLVILSVSPRYFIKIESEKFFHHAEREYGQIQNGLTGLITRGDNKKQISSFDLLTSVGDFELGLYFTPKEMSYNNASRIAQASQSKPRPDIWRLLEASREAFVYSPCFEERQLLTDMKRDVSNHKSRLLYTKILFLFLGLRRARVLLQRKLHLVMS